MDNIWGNIKLIKRYQQGNPIRQYAYGPLPSKDKWNGITTIKDVSGKELSPGDLVMSTPEGKMVTKDDTQAYLDYLAANDIPIEGPTLDQLTVTYNKNTGETKSKIGEDFEDRLKRLQQDPIANDEQIKQLWLEQGEQLWNQSHDKHVIDTRAADKAANARTPEALSLMSPALLGIAAILGFESASAMAAWAAAYPEAFTGIVGSTLGGEIINLATNLGSGGKYRDWGDAANQIWGTGETLGGFTNPGYFVNPLSKGISAIEQNGKRLLDQTLTQLNGPWAQRALNAANKYNLGEGVKAGIYNTAQSLQYGPEVATKAGLNHLKLKAQDFGWTVKTGLFPKTLGESDYLNPNLKAYKPSERQEAARLAKMIDSLNWYLVRHRNGPVGHVKYTKTVYPDESFEGEFGPTQVEVSSVLDHFEEPTFRYLNPEDAKIGLIAGKAFTPQQEEEILFGNASDAITEAVTQPFSRRSNVKISFGGMTDIKPKNKAMSQDAQDVNALLDGIGHVTGSQVTYTNPYATHTPNDIDIITTKKNLPKVLKRLDAIVTNDQKYHVTIDSKKYGAMDVQLIEENPGGGSRGKIAQQIYQKINPEAYYNDVIKSGNYTVPLSPEELLEIHRQNVLHFSNIDQLVSGNPKHAVRNLNILRSPDPKIVREAIDDMENVYKAHYGSDFLSIEDQGIHIDYNNVENNKEFLDKLGLENSDNIAKDPTRMEFLIKYLLYGTHTANRTVKGADKLTGETFNIYDILSSVHSNGSGSNEGGNWARGKFGGGIGYGQPTPYVASAEFPIRHPENLKTPMDVYNYLSKIIDVREYLYNFNRYGHMVRDGQLFSAKFMENVYKDSMLDPETAQQAISIVKPQTIMDNSKTNLSDLMTWTVPNRNENLGINMYHGWTYDPVEAEKLYVNNDNLANVLDIDHIYSLQPGFDDQFVGVYARHIPNLRKTVVKSTDDSGNYFIGFEMPTVSLVPPKADNVYIHPAYDVAYKLPSTKPIDKARQASISNNMSKGNRADQLRREAYDQAQRLRSKQYRDIEPVKAAKKLALITGIGGLTGYFFKNMVDYTARARLANKFAKELSGLYGKDPETIKREFYNATGLTLTNADLHLLMNERNQASFEYDLEDIIDEHIKNDRN